MMPPPSIGRYRLGEEIGRGAMGAVYRAHDPQLARDVAVKLISLVTAAGDGGPEEASARFVREARVAARLQHPNVVAIYDFGQQGDELYLVMELVAGETLAQRLARGAFPDVATALAIAAETAEALAAAHRAGVIHRDVKPGNLLLPTAGGVKVSDFGVAKAVGESTELTRTGMMVGSPAYMAPEQVQGMDLDGRSDLFSLGVVLYEMLLRRKPFPADTLTTLVFQILHQDPFESDEVAGRIHPDLIDFLRWAMAKERAVRIPDAVTFAARARALGKQFARAVASAPTTVGSNESAAQSEIPLPLPPPSYATSAPTEIVARRRGARGATPASNWQRWLPVGGALLLAAAIAAGWALKRPAPPPDLALPPASTSTGAALSAPTVATAAAAPTAGGAETPAPETAPPVAGERTTQIPLLEAPATRPVPAPSVPALSAPSSAPSSAPANTSAKAEAPSTAPNADPSPPPAAVPAVEETPIAAVFRCRRGVEFHVDPEETLVTLDGRLLGEADDWDGAGGGKTYTFPGPGEHVAKLSLAGFRTVWVKIVVEPSAKRDVVHVDTELEEVE